VNLSGMAMPSKAPEQFGFREAKILENGSNTENSPRKKRHVFTQ
jgi:hypothetical protein